MSTFDQIPATGTLVPWQVFLKGGQEVDTRKGGAHGVLGGQKHGNPKTKARQPSSGHPGR